MSNLAHKLHRAGQQADESFATSAKDESDLTPRQFAVLEAVAENEEPSQTTLVEKTGVDRSTLADIVRRLVEKGLLHRKRTRRDARMYAVRLTDKGQAALRAGIIASRSADAAIVAKLGKADAAELERLLDLLLDTEEGEQLAKAG